MTEAAPPAERGYEAIRVPHFPQNESLGSTVAPHAGQPYSIDVPHFPQKRSDRLSAASHDGHAIASGARSFAAHSAHMTTATPRRRTGFHAAVRWPHSAHARSRDADASTTRRSGRRSSAE